MPLFRFCALFLVLLFCLQEIRGTESEDEQSWLDYIHQYGKNYSTEAEKEHRKSVFLTNLREIERHNGLPDRNYTKAVNQFTDLSQLEFETEILTPQLAFAPIPTPKPLPTMTRSLTTAATVPLNCRRDESNCCILSANPQGCCLALGLGGWNRRKCDKGTGRDGVVPNGCVYHDSSCCRSSQKPSECCAALGFASWDNEQCRGAHAASVPKGCLSSNSHCCSESTLPQQCCHVLGFEHYDGAYCRRSGWVYKADDFLPNGYPKNFDWTSMSYRAVTGVKNQGGCGTCTFFAVTAALESAYAIRHEKDAVPLSEQQLIDCSVAGHGGCWASNFQDSINYLIRSPKTPLATEANYPYQGLSDTSSNPNACKQRAARQTGASHFFGDKELYHDQWDSVNDDLLIRLVSKGPIAIAMNADFFGGYSTGVFRDSCPPKVNHAVLLTGWGTDAKTGVPFWRIKNSWGTTWGEKGFARIERKPGANQCFFYHEVMRPIAI